MEGVLRILIVLQNTLDTMDIAVERLYALITVDRHAFEHQRVVAVIRHTEHTESLGQCIVGQITVQPQILGGLRVRFPYLQKRIGKHGLKILLRLIAEAEVPGGVGLGILLIDDAVDRHTGTQDMIGHKHIHHIKPIGIVVSCADLDTLLIDVVIPGTAVAVPLHTLLFQVGKTVDAGSAEHIVGLGKDSPLDHTLFRVIDGITITVVVVVSQVVGDGRTVRMVLAFNHEGIGKARCLKGGIEDAQVFLTLHTQLVVGGAVGTWNHVRADVQDAVDSLDIAIENGRDVIKTGETNVLLFVGILAETADTNATACLHRSPGGGCTIEIHLQMLLTGEVETGDIVAKRVGHQFHLCHHVEAVPTSIFLDTVVLQFGLGDEVGLIVI